MLEEGDLAPGSDWISDESSFYGDEEGQHRLEELSSDFERNHHYWATHHRLLNAIAMEARNIVSDSPINLLPASPEDVPTAMLPGENTDSSIAKNPYGNLPEAPVVLHNRMQGMPEAWQMGESIDSFLIRLPPVTTSVNMIGPWIWVMNPYPERRRGSEHIADFKDAGEELLYRYLEKRKQIEAANTGKAKGTITRILNGERERLKVQIKDLAVKHGIFSGKWMFFPTLKDLPSMWKVLVEAVIRNRLGTGAKVATDDGSPNSATRLICIYTYDFTDMEDVRRVLNELVDMGLVRADMPGGIFYKSDAYTHLDITGEKAKEYDLKASLYSSKTMLAGERVSGKRPSDQKPMSTPFSRMTQSKLDGGF